MARPLLSIGIHVLLAMPVREGGMTSVIFFLVVCAAGIAAAVAAIKVVGWFQVELREYRRDALQRDRRRKPLATASPLVERPVRPHTKPRILLAAEEPSREMCMGTIWQIVQSVG